MVERIIFTNKHAIERECIVNSDFIQFSWMCRYVILIPIFIERITLGIYNSFEWKEKTFNYKKQKEVLIMSIISSVISSVSNAVSSASGLDADGKPLFNDDNLYLLFPEPIAAGTDNVESMYGASGSSSK